MVEETATDTDAFARNARRLARDARARALNLYTPTMLRSTQPQREALSGILGELANLFAAAFVLGQFLRQEPLSWLGVGTGIVMWALLVSLAVRLRGEPS